MEKAKQEVSGGLERSERGAKGQQRQESRVDFGGTSTKSDLIPVAEELSSPVFGARDPSWSGDKREGYSDSKDSRKIYGESGDDIDLKNLLSISMQPVGPIDEEDKKSGFEIGGVEIEIPVELERKAPATSGADHGAGLMRPYNVEEDLRILELFWYKERIGKYHTSLVYDTKKDRLCEQMHRSFESIRDRYKRYLKFLSPSEVTRIKKESDEDPAHFYILFDKSGRGRAFKEVSRFPTAKKPVAEKKPPPEKKPKASPQPKRATSGDSGREKSSPRPKSQPRPKAEPKPRAQRLPRGQSKNLKRGPLAKLAKGPFDLEKFVAPDYVLMASRTAGTLKRIKVNTGVIHERDRYTALMRGADTRVAVKYDGKEYLFEFIDAEAAGLLGKSTPATRAVIESIEQLLGIEGEEAALKVFDGVSRDMNQLKQLIGGNQKVLWKPLDDETLKAYLEDRTKFASYYERLVKDKGEESVKCRIEYVSKK